jgi:glutathione S-transferase
MKLYQSVGPNPRVVTMFIAEKGISIHRYFLDIQKGENRTPEFLKLNPSGGTPFLALSNGQLISESLAICEYLDETQEGPKLIGSTPEERAETRMYVRRLDQAIVVPMTNGFRSAEGLKMFETRMLCVPEAAEGNKAYARDGMAQIDGVLAGKDYLAGDRFSLADMLLFCWLDFGQVVGQPIPDACANLKAWHARVSARPSAAISADPKNGL